VTEVAFVGWNSFLSPDCLKALSSTKHWWNHWPDLNLSASTTRFLRCCSH